MIYPYDTDILDSDLICPKCGKIIEDMNTYCPNCIRIHNRERKLLHLIQNDPKLSRLSKLCSLLDMWKNLSLILLVASFIIYLVIRFTGLLAHLIPTIRISLPASLILFLMLWLTTFLLDRKLVLSADKKLKRLEKRGLA